MSEQKKTENHMNIIRKQGIYAKCIKRLVDLVLCSLALIILSPIFLVISILVRKKLGSPIFFKQKRVGMNKKIFTMYKFRTMTDVRDKKGCLLPDEERFTAFGRFLRSTSCDELPELLNIIKGDMSIIGPRPLVVEYLPYYTDEEIHRHDIRPGLTGLAQVNGRSFISWEEIFSYDLRYVQNMTFANDIKIFFKTIRKIFVHENIADLTQSTKEEDGRYHFNVNGKDVILHDPLNIERGAMCKKR